MAERDSLHVPHLFLTIIFWHNHHMGAVNLEDTRNILVHATQGSTTQQNP